MTRKPLVCEVIRSKFTKTPLAALGPTVTFQGSHHHTLKSVKIAVHLRLRAVELQSLHFVDLCSNTVD